MEKWKTLAQLCNFHGTNVDRARHYSAREMQKRERKLKKERTVVKFIDMNIKYIYIFLELNPINS